MKSQIALLICTTVLLSCENGADETRIFASACAVKNKSGKTVDCKPNKSRSDDLREFLLFSIELDKTYPGPNVEPDAEYLAVESVTSEAHIILEDGVNLALAGLECNARELGEYLSAIFLENEPYKLAYQLTGDGTENLQYAYIWEVMEIDFNEAEVLLETEIGPSLSPTNETAITSKWCVPVNQPNHQYHERYERIAKQVE